MIRLAFEARPLARAVAAALLLGPAAAAGQHLDGAASAPRAARLVASGAEPAAASAPRRPAPVWAPLASALVPGAGQASLRQRRFVGYLAVETFAWLRYANDQAEGRRRRDQYRRIAREVARAPFDGRRPVGDFGYYERMEHWLESGAFDAVPGAPLEPEPDTLTYNGSIWLLARQTYWSDPRVAPDPASAQFARALAFYTARAITPEYRWSWRDAPHEHARFRRAIDRSNDAFRRATADLGLVLANHVLSAVDASMVVRLRRRAIASDVLGGADDRMRLEASLPWPSLAR